MFRCARIQGLDTLEGLLVFVKDHFYIIDGFTLLRTKEIADIDSLPPEYWLAYVLQFACLLLLTVADYIVDVDSVSAISWWCNTAIKRSHRTDERRRHYTHFSLVEPSRFSCLCVMCLEFRQSAVLLIDGKGSNHRVASGGKSELLKYWQILNHLCVSTHKWFKMCQYFSSFDLPPDATRWFDLFSDVLPSWRIFSDC